MKIILVFQNTLLNLFVYRDKSLLTDGWRILLETAKQIPKPFKSKINDLVFVNYDISHKTRFSANSSL